MFDLIRTYQLDIMLVLSAACISFALLLFFTRFLEKRRKIILIIMELVATFLLFSDRMAYIYAGDVTRTGYIMVRISNFMVFFLTSAIVFSFNLYVIDLIIEIENRNYVPLKLLFVGIGSFIGMILVIIAHFTGFYYTFDENNVYHRGPGFLFCYLIPIICPLIQYTVIRNYRTKISKLIYISLVLYIFVPVTMGIIQIFQYGISIVNMAMVLVSISLYIFTYLDINNTVMRAHQIEVGELKEGEKRMKRLFDQTTNAFVKAIEKKDSYSEGHAQKVAFLAKKIAQMAELDSRKCEEVYYAALLYNVGMIGIPDKIIEKETNLSPAELEIRKQEPVISGEILSVIEEYPYLKYGALYRCEKYDGTGFPEGLKQKNIPEVARIIAVADAYVALTNKSRTRDALPYITVREKFVEWSGSQFDPTFTQIMLKIMDQEYNSKQELEQIEKEIICKKYKENVSLGLSLTEKVKKISFIYDRSEFFKAAFSSPSLLLFDSYDRRYHDTQRSIEAFKYSEYAEIWPDGHYIATGARNMDVVVKEFKDKDITGDGYYEIKAEKYDDHVLVEMIFDNKCVNATLSLYDNSKSVYLGLTGENCHLKEIKVEETDEIVNESNINRISEAVSFTDRLESDIPNIQIDKNRSLSTDGILIEDELRLYFNSMSLPSANLVWHCPYILLFYSDNGKVDGNNFREYALIKINGEITGDESCAKNIFSMKKKKDFSGWEKWKEKTKEGVECSVLLLKRGNKIITVTENLGIAIENETIIADGPNEVYVALTGDEVAITDIRLMR